MHNFLKNKMYIKNNGKIAYAKLKVKFIIKNYPDLYETLINYSIRYKITYERFDEVIFNYLNDLKGEPLCKQCLKNKAKWLKFSKGYQTFCCRNCSVVFRNKSEEYQINLKKSTLEKYGVEYTNQRQDVKDKRNKTLMDKYGKTNISQVEEVKQKKKETNLEKRGVEYSLQCKDIRNDIKQTCLDKYGHENPFQVEEFKDKIKITLNERYDVDHPMYSKEIKHRLVETNKERYGVEYPSQNTEIFNRQQKIGFKAKKYKDTNIYYRGTYELDFLDKYYNQIKIENGPSIRYIFETKNKVYHSDFYLPKYNLIVEIKSSYTYTKYLEKNITKQKECINLGYNYIFIINKNYTEFNNIIS